MDKISEINQRRNNLSGKLFKLTKHSNEDVALLAMGLRRGCVVWSDTRMDEIEKEIQNEIVPLLSPQEQAKELLNQVIYKFFSGEYDHLTVEQLREQIKQSASPEVYAEYLKLVESGR